MSRADPQDLAGMVTLDRADCLRLLGGGVIGRVIYTDVAMPAARPVNYALVGEEIIFRTGGELAAATNNAIVAFEVDEVDIATRTGWSVLALGLAYRVTDPDRLTEIASRVPQPWAPGRTARTVAIPAWRLSGRRIGAVDTREGEGDGRRYG